MVQIDVPVAFGIGSLFADVANRQLQTGQRGAFYRVLALNNIYQTLFFSWIPVLFMLNYFGWETTYMWWHEDSIVAYPFFVPIFMMIFFTAANAGLLLGYYLLKQQKVAANRAVWVVILIYSAVWILVQPARTMHVATRSQWLAGNAPWFYQDHGFLTALIVVMVVWSGGLAFFCLKLLRKDA